MRKRDEKRLLYKFMIDDDEYKNVIYYFGDLDYKKKIKEFLQYAYDLDFIKRLDKYYLDLSWIELQNDYDTVIIDGDDLYHDLKVWMEEEALQ
jgi:hypothetical protein